MRLLIVSHILSDSLESLFLWGEGNKGILSEGDSLDLGTQSSGSVFLCQFS